MAEQNLVIERASIADCDDLLGLYVSIYGEDYPLEIGTNKKVMLKALAKPEEYFWFVMRDPERKAIAGSAIIELDRNLKIGKVTGVAVHNSYRNLRVAQKLIAYGCDLVLDKLKAVHSLYATSRTVSLASQNMLLHNGFLPLGIFPNARKIKTYETLTLMGRFAPGVLERRAEVKRVPRIMGPITSIASRLTGSTFAPIVDECDPLMNNSEGSGQEYAWGAFEFIEAPSYVERRFAERFKDDPESMFYPFHRPNMMIASKVSDLEIYCTFSRKDHYCVIITANMSFRDIKESFKGLIFAMKEVGIYYVEMLVRMDYFDTICFLAQNKFLPSAIYPAMREEDGVMHDYVLLTRTMVPLDFSEMAVAPQILPYLYQYTEEWLRMNRVSMGLGERP